MVSALKGGAIMRVVSVLGGCLAVVFICLFAIGCDLSVPSIGSNRESAKSGIETKKNGILPRPGLYRENGSGVTRELTSITATSMNFRQWQTETPVPPTDKNSFFSTGTAVLLADGLTWRVKNKDVQGYCCGNNVEIDFQVASPTTLTAIRYRLWPLTEPTPGEEDFWRVLGNVEWRLVGEIAKPVSANTPRFSSEAPKYPAPPPPEFPDLKDSGARFSSLNGEVEIYHDGPPKSRRKFVKLNAVIYVGDHIVTGSDSTAIIGFADLSTYLMKPESEIVVTTPPERESKIKLVAGNIWLNIKKMIKDGTMEVEMSQAVTGIKGTKLILESNDDYSTVKVTEGTVELTSKGGESVWLSAGETATVTIEGIGPVRKFSVAAETALWQSLLDQESSGGN